jgi:hypothetical protein
MRFAGLLAFAVILVACSSPSPNAGPTCRVWETLTEQLDQGVPKVAAYSLIDEMQGEADRSGFEELSDLVQRFNLEFTLQPETAPPSDALLEAGREIDEFCQEHS